MSECARRRPRGRRPGLRADTVFTGAVVGQSKAKDEATPNGRENGKIRTFSYSRGLIITFALTDERQRCRSGGCERSATFDTTMRDYIIQSDETARSGGIAA